MLKNLFKKALVVAALTLPMMEASAQPYDRTLITLPIPNGAWGFRVDVGQTVNINLPRRLFIHKLILQVDSTGGHSAAEVWVNRDKKGNTWLSSDPLWTVTVAEEASVIQIFGTPPLSYPQGIFSVRRIQAVVSDTDWGSPSPVPVPSTPNTCTRCGNLGFPIYYTTVMGNVSNRAIMLVDRLASYANYQEYGQYLLPIKKAAAEARAVAEARGDASAYGRPYYAALLSSLDAAQPYLSETFERGAAFQTATELLTLREHIRDVLD